MLFRDDKKGNVTEVRKIGRSKTSALEKVYHVDGLKHNLFSIS